MYNRLHPCYFLNTAFSTLDSALRVVTIYTYCNTQKRYLHKYNIDFRIDVKWAT